MSFSRPIRKGERDIRLATLEVARECVRDNLSAHGTARERGMVHRTLAQAVMILKNGTPEQVEQLESGNISWSRLYDEVVARFTKEEMKAIRSNSMSRPRPELYAATRLRAMAAAEDVRDNGISYEDAALKHNTTQSSVSDTYVILTNGTPEQIERLREGKIALNILSREIREGRGDSKGSRKKIVLSSTSKEQLALEAAIWDRLRSALTNLRDLPTPSDVVTIARKNNQRRTKTDELLMNSFSWITEFADAWTK